MTDQMRDPRQAFGAAMSALAEADERIVVISADSGKSSGFTQFALAHPERYFEVGIMEQTATGIAAGLATTGRIPVFAAIAPFTYARPFEMVRNDIGYMRSNVKIIGRNAGVSYSDLGATHHSLEDFAVMRMIPGMTILAPQDPGEIEAAVPAIIEMDGPVYVRFGNDPIPELFTPAPFVIGSARLIAEGSDVTIASTGALTAAAMQAVALLADDGISAELLGLPTVWPFDHDALTHSATKTGAVISVEEHYVIGGLGTIIQETLSGTGIPVEKLGVPHVYATTGPYSSVLSHYGLDAAGIARHVRAYLLGRSQSTHHTKEI